MSEGLTKSLFVVVILLSLFSLAVSVIDFTSYTYHSGQAVYYVVIVDSWVLFASLMQVLFPVVVLIFIFVASRGG